MIEALKYQGKGSPGIPKGPFSKEHIENLSKAMRGKGHPQSEETKRKLSEALMGRTCTEEHRRHNSEAQLGKEVSGETKRKMSEASKKWWSGLSEEERLEFLGNSFHSPKAILNRMRACRRKPTIPETLLEGYLDSNFPGEWMYNGDGRAGMIIGRKVPDFISTDSRKEVIEVLGGMGYFHFLGDEEALIEHYARYNFKCIVIWEWDCYFPESLDGLLGGICGQRKVNIR